MTTTTRRLRDRTESQIEGTARARVSSSRRFIDIYVGRAHGLRRPPRPPPVSKIPKLFPPKSQSLIPQNLPHPSASCATLSTLAVEPRLRAAINSFAAARVARSLHTDREDYRREENHPSSRWYSLTGHPRP